jgi:2'-5' RNA ligase
MGDDSKREARAASRRRAESEDSIRAFLAVELGAGARAAAAAAVRRLRQRPGAEGVRWVPEENLHVTLRFLGQVERAGLPGLAGAVREAAAPCAPFALALGPLRAFPSPRRPRVVALELLPEAPLAALAAAIEAALLARGVPPEARPFRAHLTLGRSRGPGLALDLAGAEGAAPARFDVREAVLFQSELRASGARYRALERFPLGGGLPGGARSRREGA